jgi:hypothetical protein
MTRSPDLKPDLCNCFALRQAARQVPQFYNHYLVPTGVRATQFSILAKLKRLGPMTINSLAEEMVMDRTKLGRNIHPDWHTEFTPRRIAILRRDGTLVAERDNPRASFAGHGKTTPWDPLHRAYFNGYALWTYLATPFLLALEGVQVSEIDPWQEGDETWRVLRARFPDSVATHSTVQDFFFGDDLLLRRHDYNVDVVGGFDAAQLVFDYIVADGIRLPSKRRA